MENDIDSSTRKRQSILNYLSDLDYALEPLYRIDYDRLKNIRKIVKDLEHEISQYKFPSSLKTTAGRGGMANLVGLLPLMLMSKELFPTHRSLIDFSSKVLEIKLQDFGRPARTRIIGEILTEVAKLSAKDLDRILEKLQEIARNEVAHGKRNFFLDWDSAIRRIRTGHAERET